jgi:hypothetical protein
MRVRSNPGPSARSSHQDPPRATRIVSDHEPISPRKASRAAFSITRLPGRVAGISLTNVTRSITPLTPLAQALRPAQVTCSFQPLTPAYDAAPCHGQHFDWEGAEDDPSGHGACQGFCGERYRLAHDTFVVLAGAREERSARFNEAPARASTAGPSTQAAKARNRRPDALLGTVHATPRSVRTIGSQGAARCEHRLCLPKLGARSVRRNRADVRVHCRRRGVVMTEMQNRR